MFRRNNQYLAGTLAFILLALLVGATPARTPRTCAWQVWFSPNGGCTQACVNAISAATQSILVQAYSFTSKPIAQALVSGHTRGVDVQVILDKSQ